MRPEEWTREDEAREAEALDRREEQEAAEDRQFELKRYGPARDDEGYRPEPGPCIGCGAKDFPASSSGPDVCPRCAVLGPPDYRAKIAAEWAEPTTDQPDEFLREGE